MTGKTANIGHLTFLDGVWMTHRLYRDKLTPIISDYEDGAATALEENIETIQDDLINNVLLAAQDQRANEISQFFGMSSDKEKMAE